jgi:hypothetical protein
VTTPALGRPLRQLLGDELTPAVAGELRLALINRGLWDQDLDLLDQRIPTAETVAILQAAEAAAAAAKAPPPTTDHPAARGWRRGQRS